MSGRRLFCFTIDLEPDFLSADSHEVLLDADRMERIRSFLTANALPATVFVTGAMLAGGLPVRDAFEPATVEFELHSYSHRNEEPDSEAEITRGVEAFRAYFDRPPRGYRAPSGMITAGGVRLLHDAGFRYDASVFPSWRPELGYDQRHLPATPWRYADLPGLVELPFAVVPRARVVVSLSFLKLLGWSAYRSLFRVFGLPEVVVFDSHLYDFFPTTPVTSLDRADWRRYALGRNQRHVFRLLQRLVDRMRAAGYEFVLMSELYDHVVALDLPAVPSDRLLAAAPAASG